MTQPKDTPAVAEGTDIAVDPAEVAAADSTDTPATSDPEELTDEGALGGAGGPGGAG